MYYKYVYLSPKNKDEDYLFLSKYTANRLKKNVVRKCHKQNKRASTLQSIKQLEPRKMSETLKKTLQTIVNLEKLMLFLMINTPNIKVM